MTKFEPLLKSLKEIIQNKSSFLDAINSTSSLYSLGNKTKEELKKDLLSILKNYQKLSYEACYLFPTYSYISDEILLVIITFKSLTNKIDNKKVKSFFFSAISSFHLSTELKEKFDEIQVRANLNYKIEENVKNDPLLYNSIMLELPKFLLEKLMLEYSFKDILKLAKTLQNVKNYYFLKNLYSSQNNIKIKNTITNNFDTYTTNNLVEPKEYLSKYIIFPINKVELELVSKISLNIMPNILIGGKNISSITSFIDMNFDKNNPKIISVPSDNKKENIKLKHTTILQTSFDLLKTYLVNNSYDLVIYKGEDLLLGKGAIYPELIPTVTEVDFIESSKMQANNLTTISKFLNKNGLLIFYNFSITKDENNDVINKFLASNSDFELVEKKNIFDDDTDFVSFYSIFKRKQA